MKYRVDDWVVYRPWPEDPNSVLYSTTKRAVVLDVLGEDDIYDYKIFIDGTGEIKKVKEVKLENEVTQVDKT